VSDDIDPRDQEDVVVIEQRDKHTLTYIATAAVLGIALGGLVGSIITKNQWESAYQHLEQKFDKTKAEQAEVVVENAEAVERKVANIEDQINERVTAATDAVKLQSKQDIQDVQSMVTELEKVNIELSKQVDSYSIEIKQYKASITKLNAKIDMQASIFERARELFQRELLIKQELTQLRKKRDVLEPKIARYKKECDIYLAGASFDVNSSACDKYDEVNSNMSQVDQMIEVHKLDLRDIENISDNIGL